MVYGWRALGARQMVRTLMRGRDVGFDLRDPAVLAVQVLTAAELVHRAIRHRTSPLAASTVDIEWNGPRDPGAPIDA